MKELSAKILEHFRGLGAPDRELLLKRAREIAEINGRTPDEMNAADVEQAKRDLTARFGRSQDYDAEKETTVSGRERIVGTVGHREEVQPPSDEQTYAEELVQEGKEEAEHEEMWEGSKGGSEKL